MHRYRASCSGALATYYGLHCRRKQILLSPLLINCRQLLCWGRGLGSPCPAHAGMVTGSILSQQL